ncbi:MAG: crossover junction endodeoxyribonuclease RuvC, partial [Pseudomonadota bacterium]|nr:crossover junction endodeoxyribonuclease RuvC [Pseudomonadota bacterium]
GLRRTGWGIVDYDGSNLRHVAHGTIAPSLKLDLVERLVFLHQDLLKIVEDLNPTAAAAEETFVNQNAASTLKLGLARGAILLAPALSKIPITEYAPNRVKKSLVGVGHASKEQIKIMVGKLLPKITVTCSDSADALAVAICHAHYSGVDLKFGNTNEKTLYRKSKKATSNRMNDLINRALIKEALR